MTKPEPIIISTQGIASVPITMGMNDSKKLEKIAQLPPFQMFVHERGMRHENSLQAALNYIHQHNPDEIWADYAAWHEKKGYWKNENPDGSLK